MKEIGGYFGIEIYNTVNRYYNNAYDFNYARNCLEYLIKARNIKNIYLPIYLCNSVKEKCKNLDCDIIYYHININFEPDLDMIKDNSYVYIVNYFGLLSKEKIMQLNEKFKRIIIDNAQAFFCDPIKDVDTIYSYRKFFGVPDGACLVTNLDCNINIERQNVSDVVYYMVGRNEKTANEYYDDFHKNEVNIKYREMKRISLYSENILNKIDYEEVKGIRKRNFKYIDDALKDINQLKFNNSGMTYMYPFLCCNSEKIRKRLIDSNIYVPRLWPNIDKEILNKFETKCIFDILPLPIDQRYDINDMKRIIEEIRR